MVGSGLGLGTMLQLVPFQCWISVWPRGLPKGTAA